MSAWEARLYTQLLPAGQNILLAQHGPSNRTFSSDVMNSSFFFPVPQMILIGTHLITGLLDNSYGTLRHCGTQSGRAAQFRIG